MCDTKDDIVAHALEPFSGDLGTAITTFYAFRQGCPTSPANALITLWLTASQGKSPAELAVAYDTCLAFAIFGFPPLDVDARERFRVHFLRQLATDCRRLPASWLADAVKRIKEAGKSTHKEGYDLFIMAKEIIPELMAGDPP